MSELNRVVAESLGWTINDGTWGKSPDGNLEMIPDFEHDLNAAWLLFWMLPVSAVLERDRHDELASLSWWKDGGWNHVTFDGTTPQALARAICEAYMKANHISVQS